MTEQRPSPEAREWAAKAIEKHGPLPQRLVDKVNRLRAKYATSEPAPGKRTA